MEKNGKSLNYLSRDLFHQQFQGGTILNGRLDFQGSWVFGESFHRGKSSIP